MVENKIRRLLDLYFDGETSILEEQELRSYFDSEQISEEFASYKPLFNFYDAEKQIKMKGELNLDEVTPTKERTMNLGWYWRVAASIAIFVSVFYLNRSLPPIETAQHIYQDTYDDPEKAYAEVRRALLYVSEKMNKGVDAATFSLEKMEPLGDILN